jgi:hypothetical protein
LQLEKLFNRIFKTFLNFLLALTDDIPLTHSPGQATQQAPTGQATQQSPTVNLPNRPSNPVLQRFWSKVNRQPAVNPASETSGSPQMEDVPLDPNPRLVHYYADETHPIEEAAGDSFLLFLILSTKKTSLKIQKCFKNVLLI